MIRDAGLVRDSAASTARRISSLQIQGASAIAQAALEALRAEIRACGADSTSALLSFYAKKKEVLESARPTEPLLSNALSLAGMGLPSGRSCGEVKELLIAHVGSIQCGLDKDQGFIADIVARHVPKGGVVFTHCHSNTVVDGLIKAWMSGTRFLVHNTEARPLFQGRMTAQSLSRHGIPVVHWSDSGAMDAIAQADLALFGADAIWIDGVVNKIGTRMFSQVCFQHGVPVYMAAHSLKFDRRSLKRKGVIEERSPQEVWDRPPRGVRVMNPAFDLIDPAHVRGVMSELGVMPHKRFVAEVRVRHPWLFE